MWCKQIRRKVIDSIKGPQDYSSNLCHLRELIYIFPVSLPTLPVLSPSSIQQVLWFHLLIFSTCVPSSPSPCCEDSLGLDFIFIETMASALLYVLPSHLLTIPLHVASGESFTSKPSMKNRSLLCVISSHLQLDLISYKTSESGNDTHPNTQYPQTSHHQSGAQSVCVSPEDHMSCSSGLYNQHSAFLKELRLLGGWMEFMVTIR